MNVVKMSNGCHVGYRPEKAILTTEKNEMTEAIYKKKVEIITREMLGSETLYKVYCEENGATIMVKSADDSFKEDQHVWLNVELDNLYFFDENEQRIRKNDREEAYATCVECLKGE